MNTSTREQIAGLMYAMCNAARLDPPDLIKVNEYVEEIQQMLAVSHSVKGERDINRIRTLAVRAWAAGMPIGFALVEIRMNSLGRPFDKRLVQVIYENMDCEYGSLLI